MRRLGVRAALVDGDVVAGDVLVDGGRVAAVGVAASGGGRGLAAPGFVDLQVNGYAGVDFLTAPAEGYARAAGPLLAAGVTSYQPAFVSAPEDAYHRALGEAGEARHAVTAPRLLGVHLEGPFLSPAFPGAHDPAHLVAPDAGLAGRLCAAGPVTHVTLAPELPGGLELVGHLVRRGVTVALGHSDADAATAHAAFDRGARAVTHVHNAHRPWRPRDPGLAGAALARRGVVVQAIVDGVHLAAETVVLTFLAARGRCSLVTDAVAAAGTPDGACRLGGREATVRGGAARLPDGTLAGSVGTMDAAVRRLVDLGVPRSEALAAASTVPAALAGRPELGTLRPGTPADVAVLDDDLRVVRTVVGGVERATA